MRNIQNNADAAKAEKQQESVNASAESGACIKFYGGDATSYILTSSLNEIPELLRTLDYIEDSLGSFDYTVIANDSVRLYPDELMLKKTLRLVEKNDEENVYELQIKLTKLSAL